MNNILCYQYNRTDGKTEFIPSNKVTHMQFLCMQNLSTGKILYTSYPIAGWRIK